MGTGDINLGDIDSMPLLMEKTMQEIIAVLRDDSLRCDSED